MSRAISRQRHVNRHIIYCNGQASVNIFATKCQPLAVLRLATPFTFCSLNISFSHSKTSGRRGRQDFASIATRLTPRRSAPFSRSIEEPHSVAETRLFASTAALLTRQRGSSRSLGGFPRSTPVTDRLVFRKIKLHETIASCTIRFMSRKDELRDRALDYFLEHGLAELSLRPLADEIGTSSRLLIYHFESKEKLIATVMEEARSRTQRSFAESIEHSSWSEN